VVPVVRHAFLRRIRQIAELQDRRANGWSVRMQTFTCPKCGHKSTYDPWQQSAHCPNCGYAPSPGPKPSSVAGSIPRCARCGRELGPQVRHCAERESGRCPYTLEVEHLGASGCNHLVGWPLLGFGVVAIGVGLKEIAEESNPLILCILPFPALFALFGAWFLFGKRETLRDPETGAMWQRHSLLGIETDHKIVADLEEIDLSLALPGPLDYPASISALGIETRVGTGWYRRNWITSGTDVLEATPIGMLAQDLIGVLYAITYRSDLYLPRRRRGKYMIVRGKSKEEPQSFLEKRILHVVETVRPYHSPRGSRSMIWSMQCTSTTATYPGVGWFTRSKTTPSHRVSARRSAGRQSARSCLTPPMLATLRHRPERCWRCANRSSVPTHRLLRHSR
jgi:hypothetical protein